MYESFFCLSSVKSLFQSVLFLTRKTNSIDIERKYNQRNYYIFMQIDIHLLSRTHSPSSHVAFAMCFLLHSIKPNSNRKCSHAPNYVTCSNVTCIAAPIHFLRIIFQNIFINLSLQTNPNINKNTQTNQNCCTPHNGNSIYALELGKQVAQSTHIFLHVDCHANQPHTKTSKK